MANHFRLNFYLIKFLARVNTNDGANHLGNDKHASEVCLDDIGLLIRPGLLFRLAELLDKAHRLSLETPVDLAAGTGVDNIPELIGRKVEKTSEM